jgi:hypothetical protein
MPAAHSGRSPSRFHVDDQLELCAHAGMPVMLPPGWAWLSTNPVSTGFSASASSKNLQWIAGLLGVVERKCSLIGGKLELVGDNPVDNSSFGSVNVMV